MPVCSKYGYLVLLRCPTVPSKCNLFISVTISHLWFIACSLWQGVPRTDFPQIICRGRMSRKIFPLRRNLNFEFENFKNNENSSWREFVSKYLSKFDSMPAIPMPFPRNISWAIIENIFHRPCKQSLFPHPQKASIKSAENRSAAPPACDAGELFLRSLRMNVNRIIRTVFSHWTDTHKETL